MPWIRSCINLIWNFSDRRTPADFQFSAHCVKGFPLIAPAIYNYGIWKKKNKTFTVHWTGKDYCPTRRIENQKFGVGMAIICILI